MYKFYVLRPEDLQKEEILNAARNNQANKKSGLATATEMAYKAVCNLGYKHQQLVQENQGVNFNTLRNIRDGKNRKTATDWFYLRLFVDLLETEYKMRCHTGGDGLTDLLRPLNRILCALVEIPLQ